jgi:hypothetical protein
MRRLLLFLIVGLAAGLPAAARADITYQYVTDQTNYDLTPGGTVTVSVFLQETLTNGSQSLIVADGGMLSAAVSIDRVSGTSASISTSGSAQFGSTTANTTGFNAGSTGAFRYSADNNQTNPGSQTSTHAQIGVSSGGNLGTADNVNPDSNGRILIGTLVLSASSTTSGTTMYSVGKYPPPGPAGSNGNTVTIGASAASLAAASAYDLDFTNNQSPATGGSPSAVYSGTDQNPFTFSVTVTAVPEPSSLALGLVTTSGLVLGVWRRWRNRSTEKA